MDLIGILDPALLGKIIPAVIILNVILSAASQILAVLGKNVPVLSKIAPMIQKLVDMISANPKH